MPRVTKRCAKKICPTNISNAEQKRNLLFVDRNGNIAKKPYARGGRGRGRKRVVSAKAISVKSNQLYFLKKGRNGKLRVHRTTKKQYR